MAYIPGIFALLCGIAGWYYVWHASAASRLSVFENSKDNRLRIRLRRLGGIGMVLLAAAFYVGYSIADRHGNPIAIMLCLVSVLVLLPIVLFLAWVDMRLTRKMKEAIRDKKS